MSRALVLAMLPAAVWSTATGETRWAVGGYTAPRIGIFLDFDSDPSESSLEIMRREVGAALAVTGAHFSWLKLKKAAQSETFDQLAVLRFRGKCRMEKLGLKADIPTAPLTLGETGLISGDVSVYSSVECDRIKTAFQDCWEPRALVTGKPHSAVRWPGWWRTSFTTCWQTRPNTPVPVLQRVCSRPLI